PRGALIPQRHSTGKRRETEHRPGYGPHHPRSDIEFISPDLDHALGLILILPLHQRGSWPFHILCVHHGYQHLPSAKNKTSKTVVVFEKIIHAAVRPVVFAGPFTEHPRN